jgi:APA family basic amino acid/polyamine antiporter
MTEAPTLLRVIGTRRFAAAIFNTIVGAGIFGLPGVIAGLIGRGAPVAYLACTGATLLVALSYASVGSRISGAGGSYAYIKEAMGPAVGAVGGVLAWLSDVLASAGVAAGFAAALAMYLPIADAGVGRGLVMGTVIASIAAINIRGVRQGAAFVEGMTVAKLLPLLLFIVVGASLMTWDQRVLPTWPTFDVLGRTMLVLMFAYSGAESAMSLSGEIERPERTVPRALLMSLAAISLLYSSVHIVAFGGLGDTLAQSTAAPLADAGARLAGPWLRTVMLVATLVSMLGYLSAVLMSTPRLLYSMAAGGLLPSALAVVHPRFRTPWVAIVVQNVIVFVAALTGSFASLVPLASVSVLTLYLMVAVSAVILQRRPSQPAGAFTVPAAVPVGAALLMLWMLSTATPKEFLIQGVVVVATLVLVFVRSQSARTPEP